MAKEKGYRPRFIKDISENKFVFAPRRLGGFNGGEFCWTEGVSVFVLNFYLRFKIEMVCEKKRVNVQSRRTREMGWVCVELGMQIGSAHFVFWKKDVGANRKHTCEPSSVRVV